MEWILNPSCLPYFHQASFTGITGLEPICIDIKSQCLTKFGYTPQRITGLEPAIFNLED